MVQLKLPKNSQIQKGKKFTSKNANKTFQIYRFDPDTDQNPRYDEFALNAAQCGPMVLEPVFTI